MNNQNFKISGWESEDPMAIISDHEDLSNFVRSSLRKRRFKSKFSREAIKA